MVNRIGNGGGSLANEAILAAMRKQSKQADGVEASVKSLADKAGLEPVEADPVAFKLGEQIQDLDAQAKNINDLPRALINGEVQDFHEIASQIKKAEFNFRFAMEVRNKLIDAYREVMRMNV